MPILGSFGAASGRGFGRGGGVQFITATGGTITEDGDYKIHTFTTPGTFEVTGGPSDGVVDYLVLAAGAGGGIGQGAFSPVTPNCCVGGGGGAGGYRESPGADTEYTASPLGAAPAVALPVSITSYPITVGGGGAPTSGPYTNGGKGNDSSFSTITSEGGGYGGRGIGGEGGSGGGGGGVDFGTVYSGGPGNYTPVSPPQGTNGGYGQSILQNSNAGGGGGGAVDAGSDRDSNYGGYGGDGTASSITGTPVTRAGGGGGSGFSFRDNNGGTGGGGEGSGCSEGNPPAVAGTDELGAGGGAGNATQASGAGGDGIVILRYKFQ
jgi:hypothetical protein